MKITKFKSIFTVTFLTIGLLVPHKILAMSEPVDEEQQTPQQTLFNQITANQDLTNQCLKIIELRTKALFLSICESCFKNNLAELTKLEYKLDPNHFFTLAQINKEYQDHTRQTFREAEETYFQADPLVQQFIDLIENFATRTLPIIEPNKELITYSDILHIVSFDFLSAEKISDQFSNIADVLNLVSEHCKTFSSQYILTIQKIYNALKQFTHHQESSPLLPETIEDQTLISNIITLLKKAHLRNMLDFTFKELTTVKKQNQEDSSLLALQSFLQRNQFSPYRTKTQKYCPQTQRYLQNKLHQRKEPFYKQIKERMDVLTYSLDEIKQEVNQLLNHSEELKEKIIFLIDQDANLCLGETSLVYYFKCLSSSSNQINHQEHDSQLPIICNFEAVVRPFSTIQEKSTTLHELQDILHKNYQILCKPETTTDQQQTKKQTTTSHNQDTRNINELLKQFNPETKKKKPKTKKPKKKKQAPKPVLDQAAQSQETSSILTTTTQPEIITPGKTELSQVHSENELSKQSDQTKTKKKRSKKKPVVLDQAAQNQETSSTSTITQTETTTLTETEQQPILQFSFEDLEKIDNVDQPQHDCTRQKDVLLTNHNCILDLSRGALLGHQIKIFVIPQSTSKTSPNYLANLNYSGLSKKNNLKDNNHAFSELVEKVFGGYGKIEETKKLENDPHGYKYKLTIKIPGLLTSLLFPIDIQPIANGIFEFTILKNDLNPNSPARCIHRFFRPL